MRFLAVLAAYVLVMLAFAASYAVAQAPNQLTNPSFETGTLSGWTYGSGVTVYSGGCCGGRYAARLVSNYYNAAVISQGIGWMGGDLSAGAFVDGGSTSGNVTEFVLVGQAGDTLGYYSCASGCNKFVLFNVANVPSQNVFLKLFVTGTVNGNNTGMIDNAYVGPTSGLGVMTPTATATPTLIFSPTPCPSCGGGTPLALNYAYGLDDGMYTSILSQTVSILDWDIVRGLVVMMMALIIVLLLVARIKKVVARR